MLRRLQQQTKVVVEEGAWALAVLVGLQDAARLLTRAQTQNQWCQTDHQLTQSRRCLPSRLLLLLLMEQWRMEGARVGGYGYPLLAVQPPLDGSEPCAQQGPALPKRPGRPYR